MLAVCAAALVFTARAGALESGRLDNGLEFFIEESHLVPLVTIRITFRAGAMVETPELNGLCHLYEHMLFKGNQRYPNQTAFMAALKRMGVGSWNGGTSVEYVTYYITIPADQLEAGLGFWAAAIRTPLLQEDELQRERAVVHNEIAGNQSEPGYPLQMAVLKALYPDYWFRRDVGGDLSVIDTATSAQLRFIQHHYYVPNNAALFISGDLDPDRTRELIRNLYGTWERGPAFPDLPAHRPLGRDAWVSVATSPTPGVVDVSFTFRGPDAGQDPEATHPADVWSQMVNDPAGRFKTRMRAAVPELFGGTRYIRAGYYTQRWAGTTSCSFRLQVPGDEGDLWECILRLRRALTAELADMIELPDYFPPEALTAAKQEIRNHDILSRETPAGFLANLSFWWASTSTGYYLSYLDDIQRVSADDIHGFLQAYAVEKPFLTSIWINPADDQRFGISAAVEKRSQP